MFMERVVRFYWLVGIFLVYLRPVEPQRRQAPAQQSSGRPTKLQDVYGSREFMRYCDHKTPIYDTDSVCDRVVSINKRDYIFDNWTLDSQIMAPGIFINRNHVLTSYTPFRRLVWDRKERDLSDIYVTYLRAKWLKPDTRALHGYLLDTVNVTCGRQIFPNSSTDNENHEKFFHLPSYDLMVLKTEQTVDFLYEAIEYEVVVGGMIFWMMGPQRTELSLYSHSISEHLKYVSLGMIDYDHIFERNHLHTVTIDTQDKLLANCDEWFDEVNMFICIKNVENHLAIGSGALLFSEGRVIGVGSFTIEKGKESIHVFTDVRYVLELIGTSCSEFDGYPDPITTTAAPYPTTT